jgi:hypothetical protein
MGGDAKEVGSGEVGTAAESLQSGRIEGGVRAHRGVARLPTEGGGRSAVGRRSEGVPRRRRGGGEGMAGGWS